MASLPRDEAPRRCRARALLLLAGTIVCMLGSALAAHTSAAAAGTASTALTPAAAQPAMPGPGDGIPGRLIVGLEPAADTLLGTVLGALGVVVRETLPALHAMTVDVAPGSEAEQMTRLSALPGVRYVEPDVPLALYHVDCRANPACHEPNDPHLRRQWHLQNDARTIAPPGPLAPVAGVDIAAPLAWARALGAPATRVAVIDTGVDANHPDLAGRIAGTDTLAVNGGNVADRVGHGTAVAGLIGAGWNNAVGIAGVAPNVALDVIKDSSDADNDAITTSAMASSIVAAVARGAQVINVSQGSATFSQAVQDAVDQAWSANALVIAAAGNAGTTAHSYPAAAANVLSVGATDSTGARAPASQHGDWVALTAPGEAVYTTLATYPTTMVPSPNPAPADAYGYASGTSFAAAIVSGAAALLWPSTRDANGNGFTNDDVAERLQSTADRGPDAGTTSRHGGLNLCQAVAGVGVQACPPPPPPPPLPEPPPPPAAPATNAAAAERREGASRSGRVERLDEPSLTRADAAARARRYAQVTLGGRRTSVACTRLDAGSFRCRLRYVTRGNRRLQATIVVVRGREGVNVKRRTAGPRRR